jgi:hypothetical protein
MPPVITAPFWRATTMNRRPILAGVVITAAVGEVLLWRSKPSQLPKESTGEAHGQNV